MFEHAVGAHLIGQLLVGAIPPILVDCVVTEVAFQTEHLGWRTDDFLLVGQTQTGIIRKLAGQVKRSVTVSSVDGDFKSAVLDLWSDLHNPAVFDPDHDRFAFVVQLGTTTLLRHFGALLDCAQASTNSEDFLHRMATPGLLSSTAIRYCDEIVAIVKEGSQSDATRAKIFPLLRVLHILSFDLATSTRQAEVMMKSLLSYTATDSNKEGTAIRTWNELVVLASEGATVAKIFRRDNLPEEIVRRHSICTTEEPLLTALREHSAVITRGIRSTIGISLHLPRTSLIQQVLAGLEESRIVLLSGAAGNGKSAVAKEILTLLSRDYFTFAFRAEEFAQPHFDSTLAAANVPGQALTLARILAGQDRKILLVESLERLLEKSTRDAFADLLTIINDDPTYRLLLTCRDYSTELVRGAFLGQRDKDYALVNVPALTDSELNEVQAADTRLAIPLRSSNLRRVLANPYVLDKARSIEWSSESSLPANERDFRALFWREIVRVDHRPAAAMPSKRESAFIEIALRRARALSLYASSVDLDPEALSALISDSLVVKMEEREDFVAPAHDVLEDWAILRWLDRLYADVGQVLAPFQQSLGNHPSLRRSYRKWMGELLERDSSAGETIFNEALQSNQLSPSFLDDTLIALLQSAASEALIDDHRSGLLAGEKGQLKRIIHLVRLACVTTPAWAGGNIGTFRVPEGSVWPAVLRVVREGWGKFDSEESLLLLGFVEDWANGVSTVEPYPPGADHAGAIAYSLLESFDGYSHEDELKRTLQILAKIPKTDPERYEQLLLSPRQKGRDRSRVAEQLQEMLFSGPFYQSLPTARDLSLSVIAGLRTHLICTDDALMEELEWPSSLDLELYFGLHRRVSHHYFPASAYRTPMLPLLRAHPRAAIDFLVELFNHVAEWYAHPRIQNPLEPASEVRVKLPNGDLKTHWCNTRLWNLYRGTSVGPNVLQSYLMALERWLHELAKADIELLDSILVELLSRTDNGAIVGVVAGVATAFPFQAGETLLTLLSAGEYVWLDRQRMVADLSPPSLVLNQMMRSHDPEHLFFDQERAEADRWPSRKNDLEAAIRNSQMTAFASRVQARLDEHRAALNDVQHQNDDDRLWRLALHRMDLREYAPADDDPATDEHRARGFVLLEAKEPEPDIKEMLARTTPPLEKQHQRMGLMSWAYKAFKRELAASDLAMWREKLKLARESDTRGDADPMDQLSTGAPEIMAAFTVREHWDELSDTDRDWCIERIAVCVREHSDSWQRLARAQRYGMSPDRSCAYATVNLFTKALTPAQRAAMEQVLPLALTHPVEEVRWFAAHAAGELWQHDAGLVLRCVFAIAMEAGLMAEATAPDKQKPYHERRSYEEISRDSANRVRALFWQRDALREEVYDQLLLDEWHGAEAQNRILAILGQAPEQPLAAKAFGRAAQELVNSWKSKYDRDGRRERNIETDIGLADLIEQFVLRAPLKTAVSVLKPILEAVDRHADEVHNIFLGILHVEDREPHTQQFWDLWKLFTERAKSAPWLDHIDNPHSSGASVIRVLFLGTRWKDETRHWRSLEGYDQNIHRLFEELAPSSCAMDAYVRFLYHVGERSLPFAFIRIHNKAISVDPKRLFRNSNTRFCLEIILQRYVYSKPLLLKARPELREAVLVLLDSLIDLGSSAAFKMRDDFVTPVSA